MTAPIIVTATFAPADFTWLDRQRRAHFPAERNRVPAHLTLFHHLPPSIEAELRTRLAAAVQAPRPDAMLAAPILLGRGVAYRIDSPALAEIRADLAEAFAGLLVPQDQAGWRPHVTIQNKVEPGEARRLHAELSAGFTPRPLTISGLASWSYLGGDWAPLTEHRFR